MARVKRGVIARARHKKILKQAKGYYGARSRVYRVAFQAVIKAGQYGDFTLNILLLLQAGCRSQGLCA